MKWWRLILLPLLRNDKYWTNQEVFYCNADLTPWKSTNLHLNVRSSRTHCVFIPAGIISNSKVNWFCLFSAASFIFEPMLQRGTVDCSLNQLHIPAHDLMVSKSELTVLYCLWFAIYFKLSDNSVYCNKHNVNSLWQIQNYFACTAVIACKLVTPLLRSLHHVWLMNTLTCHSHTKFLQSVIFHVSWLNLISVQPLGTSHCSAVVTVAHPSIYPCYK